MADEVDEYSEISEFLRLSDLLSFILKFIGAGVTKNEHFQDVDEQDLNGFGLSSIEIKRFFRKRKELFQPSTTTTNPQATDTSNDSCHAIRFGSVTFNRVEPAVDKTPWEKKSLGWIPNPTTKRAKFMNNVLPFFYKSMYPACKNAREFVKRFHDEGRHEYDAECEIERLQKKIDAVLDPNNPAVAGKFISDDYVYTLSDLPVLRNNLKVVQDIKMSIDKQEEDAKNHLSSHFSKTGKLLPGHSHPKTFDENLISKLIKVKQRVIGIEESLETKSEKVSNMFKYDPKVKNRKRSQKENRRKAKKRKVLRNADNIKKVRVHISNALPTDIIQVENIKLEALSTLSLSQTKYLQLMHEAGQLSPAAVNLITEYVSNFPRKGQENDNESDSDDDDEGNSDDGDVIEVDSGDDDSSANDDEDNKDYDSLFVTQIMIVLVVFYFLFRKIMMMVMLLM